MKIWNDSYGRFVVTLFGSAVVVLGIATLLLEKGEDVLMINGMNSPAGDAFFSIITNMGDGSVFIPVIILLLFVRIKYSVISLVASLSHGAIANVLKYQIFDLWSRPMTLIDNKLLHFVPGLHIHEYNSFPSGHTATAFCAAFILSLVLRRKWAALLLAVLAMVVAYSRVYLAQHFVMDVAGGALLGMFVAWLSWRIFDDRPWPWMNKRLDYRFRLRESLGLANP